MPKLGQHIVITGAGTARRKTAAALAKALNANSAQITLVESEQSGRIGICEATIPSLHYFSAQSGIDQAAFMRTAQPTAFWRHWREMEAPNGVRDAIDLFEARGRILASQNNRFTRSSRLSVRLAQGRRPSGYDHLADTASDLGYERHMRSTQDCVDHRSSAMPRHIDPINRFLGVERDAA